MGNNRQPDNGLFGDWEICGTMATFVQNSKSFGGHPAIVSILKPHGSNFSVPEPDDFKFSAMILDFSTASIPPEKVEH
jgi:hypothetical protein